MDPPGRGLLDDDGESSPIRASKVWCVHTANICVADHEDQFEIILKLGLNEQVVKHLYMAAGVNDSFHPAIMCVVEFTNRKTKEEAIEHLELFREKDGFPLQAFPKAECRRMMKRVKSLARQLEKEDEKWKWRFVHLENPSVDTEESESEEGE